MINALTEEFGDCNGPENALYQLQEGYVQDIFNAQVPDLPGTRYATIAFQGNDVFSGLILGEDDGMVSVDSVRHLGSDNPATPRR